ncbi:MAG: SURF1 family cytochrome oxidase biogenesis protein [Pseudonocardiaceae bacterium]
MRWTFLLRPSWLALMLVSVAFAAFAFLVLSPWQFHRGEERSARNTAIEQSFTTPPAPLRDVLPADTAPGRNTQWRQVELTGRYVAGTEVVARLRTVQGEPAFEVLAPFRLADGTTVLVDRGFLRPVPGVRLPAYPPPPEGEVTVRGRVRIGEPVDARPVVERDGATQVYTVSPETVGAVSGLTIEPGYVQLNESQPGVLGALPLPQLSAGPHLAYALQWLAFGLMAPLGVAYFAWREGTGERRRPELRDDDPHDRPAPAATTAPTAR